MTGTNFQASGAVDPALESLLGFWADAGVDCFLLDEPLDRLAEGRLRLSAPAKALNAQTSVQPLVQPRLSPLTKPVDPQALEDARRLASAANSLEELEAAIAAFDGSTLKSQGARQAVFARGDSKAPVMIIGEAPGAEEDLQGQPFVGRAGKLLDRMLIAAGLADKVFITNTVFWRPPANRTPSLEEQAACAPFVERAIELVEPKRLLLLGGAAAKSMLGRAEGILSLRGRWTEWRGADGQPIPALPTLHPAFLLRQPGAKKQAWSDLLSLRSQLDRDGIDA